MFVEWDNSFFLEMLLEIAADSLVPRLSAQLFFAHSKISYIKKSWAESLGTRLSLFYYV